MKIVLAPDSFKGSLTSLEAATTMKQAIQSIDEQATISIKPMADGGEGTVDVLLASTKGEKVPITCTGPLGTPIHTYYAVLKNNTAVIEIANIAGLTQIAKSRRNPDITTTYGLGEVIKAALDRGCTSFIIGLGGSATNDGGFGLLQALGMRAWNHAGSQLGIFGKDMLAVKDICFSDIDPRLRKVHIQVACDVDNPLVGDRGASAIYGPQKGATKEQIIMYDKALSTLGKRLEVELNQDFTTVQGAGAAGGLGFALLAIGAELTSGAALIGKASGIDHAIRQADLVITGEGQSDEQTLYGKAPGYIVEVANKNKVPAILLSGSLSGDLAALREKFDGCFSIITSPSTVEACMENADRLLFNQTVNILHLIQNLKS
ncbi:glycerate kinase [Virgibacillus salexigens]|uniref:Glycerate kinase n=1 Tax=Virgibacillus kapii TaxID=1638645 RepID=A0ABQ2DDK6_9BACI|nr:glycerate kinase [Virgibacillus kapii]GGJ54291.1 glycerate kinase [Virgibacillus kapii]